MFNETRRRKTGGSFNSFITADNNRAHYASGKTRKGIDVKLEKDRNGNPTAWLIGGDAPWDESFEELKKGAKGGRYKAFIAELFKTYPRFNNFTQSGKGIKLSHAMFCKLFMHGSVLGRMYPRLIAEVNNVPQLKCVPIRPVEPKPVVRVAPVVVDERAVNPVVPAVPAKPVVPAVPVKPVVPAVPVKPVVPAKPVVPVKPVARDAMRQILDQSFTRRQSFPRRQSAWNQSFPRRQSAWDQSFTRRQSAWDQRFTRRQSFPRQGLLHRTHRTLQQNLNHLTDMGFHDMAKNANALMKHNNNLEKALDELTMIKRLDNSTRNERTPPTFTTTIVLLKSTARKKFTIRDNGGSGDCLFISLAETLTRAHKIKHNADINATAHDLRQKIVKYVMTHLDNYFIKDNHQTFRDAIHHGVVVNGQTLYMGNYEDEMKKQSTYGTELEISAAAQLYNINIYVVNIYGISFDQLYVGNHHPNWQNMWYIFNYNNAHYTSLLCDDAPGGCPH